MHRLFMGNAHNATLTSYTNTRQDGIEFYPVTIIFNTQDGVTDVSAHATSREDALRILKSIRDNTEGAIKQLEIEHESS